MSTQKNPIHAHLCNHSINQAGRGEVLMHVDCGEHLARCLIAPSCDYLHLIARIWHQDYCILGLSHLSFLHTKIHLDVVGC